MKIIQDIKQGTLEWLKWRESGIGGSDVAAIMNISPFKTSTDLWLEKTGQKEPEDLSGNFIVQRGHALEPEARKLFEEMTGKSYEPCLFESEYLSWGKVSCDGFDGKETIIEIKCNGNKSHELAMIGQVPPYYMAQMQYTMAISGAKSCHYISYNPDHASPLVSFEVKQDLEMQKTILEKVSDFWDKNITEKIQPETKQQLEEIQDQEIQKKIKKLKEVTLEFKKLEEQKEELEKEIKAFVEENKLQKANFDNVFISEINRVGAVDYAKIPELQGVNLENYRKKGSKYYKIEIKD